MYILANVCTPVAMQTANCEERFQYSEMITGTASDELARANEVTRHANKESVTFVFLSVPICLSAALLTLLHSLSLSLSMSVSFYLFLSL